MASALDHWLGRLVLCYWRWKVIAAKVKQTQEAETWAPHGKGSDDKRN